MVPDGQRRLLVTVLADCVYCWLYNEADRKTMMKSRRMNACGFCGAKEEVQLPSCTASSLLQRGASRHCSQDGHSVLVVQ